MTVKELIQTVRASAYNISSNGLVIPIDPSDELQLDAFGQYVVDQARVYNNGSGEGEAAVEICLKAQYVRKEA